MADDDAPVMSENAKRFKPLKERLLFELKANPLDFENPPTEPAKDTPNPILWVADNPPNDEANPKGVNSIALLNQMNKWELEPPSMSLIVHSGAAHPFYLITDKGLREQRSHFLKSRPRFNDNYFDGNRDPVEGWMTAVNAWRYPAFFIGPQYAMPEFTFKPPHTLFIDAALQAQDDSELIGKEDRVNNEWIMDAVTHQPLGKQSAMKGADGVFYWDLNVKQKLTPEGSMPPQTTFVGNMRAIYDEWWAGMKEQEITLNENNPLHISMTISRSKFLVGTTRPKNIKNWNRLTNLILLKELRRVEAAKESELDPGEVRVEMMTARLNKTGITKMGAVNAASAGGDGLIIVRSFIPGDNPELQSSEPYPIKKGHVKFKGRSSERIERRYQTKDNAEERAELNEILEDHDPTRSEIFIEILLATKNGRELPAGQGLIGTVRVSLKELLRDGRSNEAGTCESSGEFELSGAAPEDKKSGSTSATAKKSDGKKRGVKQTAPKLKRQGSSIVSKGSSRRIEPIIADEEAEEDDDSAEEEEEEEPAMMVQIGTIFARVAIRPPEAPPKGAPPPGIKAPRDGGGTGDESARSVGGLVAGMVGLAASQNKNTLSAAACSGRATPSTEQPQPTTHLGVRAAASLENGSPETDNGAGVMGGAQGIAPIAWPGTLGDSQRTTPQIPPLFAPGTSLAPFASIPPPPAYPPPGMSGSASKYSPRATPAPLAPIGGGFTPAPGLAPAPMIDVITPAVAPAPSPSYGHLEPPVSPPPSPGDGDEPARPASPAGPVPAAPEPPMVAALSEPPPLVPVQAPPPVSVPDQGLPGEPLGAGLTSVPSLGQLSGAASDAGDGGAGVSLELGTMGNAMSLLAKSISYTATKDTMTYTFAYWIKWKPMQTLSDQLLFFGDTRNMPALIRGNKLGALVDNKFCATDFDPRLAGDNWCMLVITNDGANSKFYIGYSSKDRKGVPQPARSGEVVPGQDPTQVRTDMAADVQIRRLETTTKGAGLLAQAWIWPRDLEPEEIEELWVETKGRYPAWKPGMSTYRPPPTPGKKKPSQPTPKDSAKRGKSSTAPDGSGSAPVEVLPWEKYDPIIEKDNALMLEVPLASKLAFQRLKNVFQVLVDYATYSNNFIVIDRIHNPSPCSELLIEVALRANGAPGPLVVLVMDSRTRLERADQMLYELINCGFLIDQEATYKKDISTDKYEDPKLTEYKLTSTDYAGPKADLRRLVTPAGLAWLRAPHTTLKETAALIDNNPRKPEHANMTKEVTRIYREFGFEKDLQADGRPALARIWRVFYDSQLFASGTHYIVFDNVEVKGKPIVSNLGTLGTIFINGSTEEHRKIVECIQEGSPILLLEATGGVAQAFAYVMKVVKMMKPKWDIDFVLRLVTEYRQRAAKAEAKDKKMLPLRNHKYVLPNIELLDKELARIDLLLSAGEHQETWMRNFGLPEVLMLFEAWQRSSDFLKRQVHQADIMKKSAEDLLDLFTACFSGAAAVPELGLGNAETKVVATAWNRHLILFNNALIYNKRSWTMQFVLYFLALCTTSLSILTSKFLKLKIGFVDAVMLLLPIMSALLGTVGTRLRQQQKFSTCKMASFEIVSEIYKFRSRTMEYNELQLAAALQAAKEGPGDKKKKKDDEPVPPISNKEKDRLARSMFVSRIKAIYTGCMQSEMSKGTSVRHQTEGMDPKRMLIDDDEDGKRDAEEDLQKHVASSLYFITMEEWELTAEVVRGKEQKRAQSRQEAFVQGLRSRRTKLFQGAISVCLMIVIACVKMFFVVKSKIESRVNKIRSRDELDSRSQKASVKSTSMGDEVAESSDPNAQAEAVVKKLREKFAGLLGGVGVGNLVQSLEEGDEEGDEEHDEERGTRRLDTSHIEEHDEAGDGAGDAEGGDEGGKIRVRDNMLGAITITDYMKYRARPICTYLERTAPWRAFELQCLEVAVFVINSTGAILVALDNAAYVALTVSIAAVCKSFIEFSRLDKQVEAYNSSQREIHNLINDWDGQTRTERRTRKTMTQVVSTVEGAMTLVAIALTDAIPLMRASSDEGEGDGDEKKEE